MPISRPDGQIGLGMALGGLRVIGVPSGRVVICRDSGRQLTVTDETSVRMKNDLYVTHAQYSVLNKRFTRDREKGEE